jgi:hypothetical protein
MATLKAGRFFRIPERPEELPLLWNQARPLEVDRLPAWLTWEDAAAYRDLEWKSSRGLTEAEIAAFRAEIEELELAGLIVDQDGGNPEVYRVFIEEPRREAVWSIGIFQGPSPWELSAAGIAQPVLAAKDVTDVVATFVADPFLLYRNDRWHMFFEVMNWKANKGEIGLAVSDDGLSWRYEQIVLAEEFHLSYPHVLADGDEVYIVPESFQANSVRLYRARRFPYEWQCVGELLSGGYYADSTPFRHEGSWWMFTETGREADNTLRLFHADRLQGPWREHCKSPIVSGNAHLSRPAGRVIAVDERIYRFAQNCDPEYGRDVRAVEITRLSRSDYREQPLGGPPILGPAGQGWNSLGMHHLDASRLAGGTWLAAGDGWTK